MLSTATRSFPWVKALQQSITDGLVVAATFMLVDSLLVDCKVDSFPLHIGLTFFILYSKRLGALKSSLQGNSNPPWGKSDNISPWTNYNAHDGPTSSYKNIEVYF